MADTTLQIELGRCCTIAEIEPWLTQWQAQLEQHRAWLLDASQLEEADGATLQLLIALAQTAKLRQVPLQWQWMPAESSCSWLQACVQTAIAEEG